MPPHRPTPEHGVPNVPENVPDEPRLETAGEEGTTQPEWLYRLLVESVLDYAIFMLDPDGHVLTWNAGAERLKGYAPDEIIGQHFSRSIRRRTSPPASPSDELEIAARDGRFEDEGWRVRKDGTRFWANVVITALRDAAGNLRRLRQGHARPDRAAPGRGGRCERSEERFRLLVESVQDYAIFMLDPDGQRRDLERGRRAHQGLPRRRDHRPALLDLLPAGRGRAPDWPRARARGGARRGRFEDEGWRVRKDGSRFWANVVITAVARRGRRARRLRQGDARPDGAPGGRGAGSAPGRRGGLRAPRRSGRALNSDSLPSSSKTRRSSWNSRRRKRKRSPKNSRSRTTASCGARRPRGSR